MRFTCLFFSAALFGGLYEIMQCTCTDNFSLIDDVRACLCVLLKANKVRIASVRGIEAIINAMSTHKDSSVIQENACGALRNLALNDGIYISASLPTLSCVHFSLLRHAFCCCLFFFEETRTQCFLVYVDLYMAKVLMDICFMDFYIGSKPTKSRLHPLEGSR